MRGLKEEEEEQSSEHLQVSQISKETMATMDLSSWHQIMTVSQFIHSRSQCQSLSVDENGIKRTRENYCDEICLARSAYLRSKDVGNQHEIIFLQQNLMIKS